MGSNRVIAARYELLEEIGSGGQGVVWRAFDPDLERIVAMKCAKQSDGDQSDRQIRREAVQGAALNHPNVILVFDSRVEDGERWVVQEYFASRDLAALVRADGALPPERAARVGEQLASALALMHANRMVHQDVKPANVLVNDKFEAKLTDLGIARWAEETQSADGAFHGTPAYVAPEVANGEPGTAASDVFSLGATLYFAVVGRSPWGGPDVGPIAKLARAARYDMDPHGQEGPLGQVLDLLLHRDPRRRPTAEDARAMLHEVTNGSELTIRIPSLPEPPRRRRWPRYVGVTAAVAALVAAGVVIWRQPPPAEDKVNLLGDAKTVDPCALVDPAALSRFGQAVVDDDYGNFNRCDVLVRLKPDDPEDEVDVRVVLLGYAGTNTPTPTATAIGPIQRPALKDKECERVVHLPDGHRIRIEAEHTKDRPAPLCDMAEALTSNVLLALHQGQVKRRATEPAADSLVRLDACALLSRADLAPVVGDVEADPGYGDWNCEWVRGRREIYLEFDRHRPLTEKDGRRVDLGRGVEGFVEVDHDGCEASVPHRPLVDAYGHPMIELVKLHFRDDLPGETLCPQLTELAKAVVSRLPR